MVMAEMEKIEEHHHHQMGDDENTEADVRANIMHFASYNINKKQNQGNNNFSISDMQSHLGNYSEQQIPREKYKKLLEI